MWWQGAAGATAVPHSHAEGNAPGTALLAQSSAPISEDEAAAIVRKLTGGRILGVRRRIRGDRLTYDVKVLSRNGRVSVYTVDGATGEVRH